MQRAGSSGLHLSIRNLDGSVEHYYHFLLGFLAPLVHWHRSSGEADRYGSILVRSCAILDPILREVRPANVEILDRDRHRSLASESSYAGGALDHQVLEGFDHPRRYSAAVFDQLAEHVAASVGARAGDAPAGRRVLMVDRETADPYYASARAEIKTAGSERRSIPNFAEIASSLAAWSPQVTTLQGRSLAEQRQLFARANVVIAQHGAALANIVFCRPGTTVVEIVPGERPDDCFRELASVMRLRHVQIRQDGPHAPVDPRRLVAAVEEVLGRASGADRGGA